MWEEGRIGVIPSVLSILFDSDGEWDKLTVTSILEFGTGCIDFGFNLVGV